MKFIAIMAASLAVASPAMANNNEAFTGARVEATVGYNNFQGTFNRNDVVYGAAAGVDLPVGKNFTIGAEANTSNIFDRNRTIGAAARVGYAFTPRTLGYVKAGYANYRQLIDRNPGVNYLDGAVVGAGLEYKISKMTFVKAEYRYSDFSNSRAGSHATVVGLGLRF